MSVQEEKKIFLIHEEKMILAYNMRIIQVLWKSIKGDFGENLVRDNEHNADNLYGSLGKSRQTIREIVFAEKDFEKHKIVEWANRIEKKTGIPKDYLAVKERIKLVSSFEEEFFPLYEDYIADCDKINDIIRGSRRKSLNWSTPKIKKYLKEEKTFKEQKAFKDIVGIAEKALENIRLFEQALTQEIDRVKEISSVRGLRENVKRYRLIYFIRFKKKYGANHIEKIDDIMRVFDDIHTVQLKELGEAGLRMYIEELKKQLTLAEAVYTVAVDCGDFKI